MSDQPEQFTSPETPHDPLPPPEKQETFLSHLVELRQRLVRALLAVLVVFLALIYWSSSIYDLFAYPMLSVLPEGTKMIATGVISPLMVPIKVTALVAFMLALPVVLYQVWAFVAPGLYEHEKKLVFPLVILSWILFLIGIGFCYFFVFGTVFKVIYSWAPTAITVAPDIEQYLSFVLTMFLAFGVTFEVPVIVMVLVRAKVVTIVQLKAFRSYFIVSSFVIAAVVTPPDVVSQLLLAIPLCILYEVGILFARFMERNRPAPEP
ncbi:MAG: twin-arginine translocase subunit TatC, partial [Burkholderiales bacterium]